jgi:hypothetical protein
LVCLKLGQFEWNAIIFPIWIASNCHISHVYTYIYVYIYAYIYIHVIYIYTVLYKYI